MSVRSRGLTVYRGLGDSRTPVDKSIGLPPNWTLYIPTFFDLEDIADAKRITTFRVFFRRMLKVLRERVLQRFERFEQDLVRVVALGTRNRDYFLTHQ